MFKVSGATVYPAEVEAGLRAIPFVRQAYVTDVRRHDPARRRSARSSSSTTDVRVDEVDAEAGRG